MSKVARWFSGKTALVTGATSGIGREIARCLNCYNSRVLLCGRDEVAMKSLQEELNASSAFAAEAFPADLSDKDSVRELITKVSGSHEVDILVNNAGFGDVDDFYLMNKDKVHSMQQVNISAVVDLCRYFLAGMKEKAGSGILNVGSVASFFPTPGSALYGATKHFILGFTDAIHEEMRSFGVHVTGVYPGKTKSRFLERATEGKKKDWGQAMEPESVAELALKALSENRIRVIPGFSNRLKVFIASVMPTSLLLKKSYINSVKSW